LLRDLGLERGIVGWRAVESWAEIVGPRIARRTKPVSFHEGVLRVEVEGSSWACELEFLKRRFLKEMQRRLGSDVRGLHFVTTRGGIQR
jgi:predicted nucleic acid-binding Zn ribbon protein